ncbi:hypothetical protein RJ639_023514 [Escallonia herrerae]|uniref:Uncharacterized protein n=1 Tax=Escallonia herrerae TaxID=1293975 RepID=A0AA88V0C6_9ASTE|nr:hypothetical protein RJ639_023514 [Escallonia herrerae]
MVALDSGGLGRIEGKRKERGKEIVGWKQICHWGVSDGDCGQCGIDFTKNIQMGIDSSRFFGNSDVVGGDRQGVRTFAGTSPDNNAASGATKDPKGKVMKFKIQDIISALEVHKSKDFMGLNEWNGHRKNDGN